LNKLKRKEAKAKAKAESKGANGDDDSKQESTTTTTTKEGEVSEEFASLYNDVPIICSAVMTDKCYRQIPELNEDRIGQQVWIRGRVVNSRTVGKGVFIILRQQIYTTQAVMFAGSKIPKEMVKYGKSLSLESIVDILAEVTKPEVPIESCTIKNVELSILEIHAVSRAQELPFLVEDAGRNEEEALSKQLSTVNPDNCLNFRWIDLRTPANQSIFRIQSGVTQLFREFLLSKNFIEIHTPKLIGGASEGGANVFTLKYFDQPACLAQSPQLYKQMAAACGGFDRVFEIGPVFRAENSNTHRHLCEFTGLDFEMAIYEHYYEALDVMSELFLFIFDGIAERYSHELKVISQQYPFEPIKYMRPTLKITFEEGINLLRAAGTDAPYDEDISTPHEKQLGKIVKEKYGTDFYMMDKYPLPVRPFYTMPDPNNPAVSNSYDVFIRGEEIVSGAQRVHDVNLLIERATKCGIPIQSIQSYVDAFKHGALPHAGGGIGLERVVMLYLGLKNIRKTSMFPRDPSRLTP
jgi:aspartyl-tRNA synthetase